MLEKGDLVCKCMESIQCGKSVHGGASFFNLLLKLTNQKRPKVTCLICH